MAQNDFFKRYLDAGLEFTAMTQSRAEALVRDLVSAGEVQADQARETVAEFLERSRRSSERLVETVRQEVKAQITNLGLASQADVDRAEQRLRNLLGGARQGARKTTAKASTAKRSAAKKATAKKSTAKKSTAKKSTAKKSATKKSTAKKATAKRATAAKKA